jgi:hypothetical protein
MMLRVAVECQLGHSTLPLASGRQHTGILAELGDYFQALLADSWKAECNTWTGL